MYGSYGLTNTIEKRLGQADSLDPRASKLFDKVLRETSGGLLSRFFRRELKPILVLKQKGREFNNRHYAGSKTVALKSIHGTIDRDGDFDYNFAPLKRANEHRWCKVASAMLRGIGLPPVELIRVGDEFFVKDGHHRISVARALGFGYIDAIVEVWS